MHVMPNFRLQEIVVSKNENIFLVQIFFYKDFFCKKKFKSKFSAKSVHVMPNFRLQETVVSKNENIFLVQIFFYKEKIKKTKNKNFQPKIFSKISARNAQFQTTRNTVL